LDDLDAAGRTTVGDALVLTLLTSIVSLLLIIGAGTPLAFGIARRSFRGKAVLETLIDLPMVLPPAVAGLALLMAFGRRGVLGGWLDDAGVRIGFTTTAVVFAQVFVASPFYVRAARAAFSRVETTIEEAASDLGATPIRVMRSVTLPLAAPGLMAGAVLAWARAVGEFGATIMFAGNLPRETQTLPLAIYGRYEAGDLETALAMALILLVSSFLVLLSVRGLGGRLRVTVVE
jgi:molybdate transport system permease protein